MAKIRRRLLSFWGEVVGGVILLLALVVVVVKYLWRSDLVSRTGRWLVRFVEWKSWEKEQKNL